MKRILTIVVCGVVVASAAYAMPLKDWIKLQDTRNTSKLIKLATERPVLGYNDYDTTNSFDKLTVLARREAKRIAELASIAKTDTPAEMDAKMMAYVDAASTTPQIKLRLYNATKFWVCYFKVQDTDANQSATYVVHHHDPIYGQNAVEVNGWDWSEPGDAIEKAQR